MAQPLQNITIAAPGFLGINTQDAPIGLNPSFASVADNCVIDKYGRIGARNGHTYLSTNGATVLGSSDGIEVVHEHTKIDGSVIVFSCGNNKIFSGTTTLTDISPGSYTISGNDWKIVSFNTYCYFFQRGHEPLVWEDDGTFGVMSAATGAAGTPPQGNEVLAAYGRLWTADITGDKSTVYWSDLLLGSAWTGGSSGSIDVTKFWPTGYDTITALAAHNGFLIIFGKRSILVYSGADTPSTMVLNDSIASIGAVGRDTVSNTGSDLLFFSETGVRSLMRTIVDGSAPLRDASKNVRDMLLESYSIETEEIRSIYSPEFAFYLLLFRSTGTVYCFDMRAPLEDDSFRVTTWTGIEPLCFARTADGDLLMGHPLGITQYTGYADNDAAYLMSYYTSHMDFDSGSNVKFLKKFALTIIGGLGASAFLKWAYDYTTNYYSESFTFATGTPAYYGIAEYGIAEYTPSVVSARPNINTSGSGIVVKVGIEASINGYPLSIQKMDILALIGRTI